MLSDDPQDQDVAAQPYGQSVSAIDSIESLYQALGARDEIKAQARLMLLLRSWLTEVASFDPVSGHALPTGIIDVMDLVAKSMQDTALAGETKDRIYRIVSHTQEAVISIVKQLRDKILREYAMLPIYAAREVDSNSIRWLSRKPGRTFREKLSGKPYIKAVRRRPSVDTAENRLLKAFLFRLEQILLERQDALAGFAEKTCAELLVALQRWLRSEDAAEIGAWGNLPPNNTLLQDKHYRKAWDGWLWLQQIDEHIKKDRIRIYWDILCFIYWNTLTLVNRSGRFRTVQQPVTLDYDNFSISPALPIRGYLFPDNSDTKETNTPKQIAFQLSNERIAICVDEETISVQIDTGHIVFKTKGAKQQLKLSPDALIQTPQTIWPLLIDSPVEIPDLGHKQNASLPPMADCVVDLCAIRPTFSKHTGSPAQLPFRLLQQTWTLKDGTKHVLDCGTTKAIALHPDIETISMRSLFLHHSTLSDAAKSSASMFFAEKLNDYITAERLTYLVPDWGNDFDLESVRKSVNFYFAESAPLPKSIAAIFAWQSSAAFKNYKIDNKTAVLVIDSFYGGFSVTPITAKAAKGVQQKIPQTNGITWERHPSFIIEHKAILEKVLHNLGQATCPYPDKVIQLFGLEGLAWEAGKLSIEENAKPFHVPRNIVDQCIAEIKIQASDSDELKQYLNAIKHKTILVLPLSKTVKIDPLLHEFHNLAAGKQFDLVAGGLTLNKWQQIVKADDIALWRDHLPELSFKDIPQQISEKFFWWDDFNLVKDVSVVPRRGKPTDIPIKKQFILPVNSKNPQNHYRFGLSIGKGKKELQFVAYLQSPAFPLKKDTACKLKMTYTYGADDPYELKFIPTDSKRAAFKSIRVEWRSASAGEAIDLENLPIPAFPARKTWADFQQFPKEDGKNFSNLLEWVKRDMEKICDIANFFDGEDSNRIYDDDVVDRWYWTKDRYREYFCLLEYDFGYVFFHERNFDKFDPDADEISFDLEEQRDRDVYVARYVARNVTLGRSIPKETTERFKKSLRFPVFTIWNQGHSLAEPTVPDHFRNTIHKAIPKILAIIEAENMPDTLKEELFLFLCCLHQDAPDIVASRLLAAVKDKERLLEYHRHIAFAIGAAELEWQQTLLQNLIDPVDHEISRSITLQALAIALWRSETLILKLSEADLTKLCTALPDCIQSDIKRLTSAIPKHRLQSHLEKGLTEADAQSKERGYQANTLCKHLELLLALLRSRGNQGKAFKQVLAPDNALTQKYITLVEEASKLVIEKNIQLKSRISLQIDKPPMFCNTPDLLYALRMYLTGDSGANTIVITGVRDED